MHNDCQPRNCESFLSEMSICLICVLSCWECGSKWAGHQWCRTVDVTVCVASTVLGFLWEGLRWMWGKKFLSISQTWQYHQKNPLSNFWDMLVSVNYPGWDLMHMGDISVPLNKERHTLELAPLPEHILVDTIRRYLQNISLFWELYFQLCPGLLSTHMPFRWPQVHWQATVGHF